MRIFGIVVGFPIRLLIGLIVSTVDFALFLLVSLIFPNSRYSITEDIKIRTIKLWNWVCIGTPYFEADVE